MSDEARLFTPEEANQTLPLVRKIVEDILQTGRDVRELHAKHGRGATRLAEFREKMVAMEELMAELKSIGCTYKDWNFEVGLVDFPAIIDGEEVLLCWRTDEPALRYYHGVNAGFAGRREIPADMLPGIPPGTETRNSAN